MSYRKRIEEKVTDIPQQPKDAKKPTQQNVNPTMDDTKMTKQELKSILKAMDNDGFDNIMDDYIKEISNPDNIKETNQYLKEMQDKKDVPSNVKLVKPFEGFCLKTKKIYKNLSQKVYVNICSYDGVQCPFVNQENKNYWNIPFLLNKSRNDQDDKGNHVLVFDVVFHSESIKKANNDIRFKKLVCDSAINGINDNLLKEKNEKVSSDYKILTRFNYKGKEVAYINIHTLDKSEFANKMLPAENYKTGFQKEIDTLKSKNEEIKEEEEKEFDKIDTEKPNNEFLNKDNKIQAEFQEKVKPKHTIKYYDEIELHNYFYDPNNQGVKPYSKLSIDIQTPLMESLDKQAILDITSRILIFKYKEIYELSLNLPCEINVDKCRAKFDRSRKVLNITCSILNRKVEGNSINFDPNIEQIYEENNKIIEKRGKIEEVTVNQPLSNNINHKEPDIQIKENIESIEGKKIENELIIENSKIINPIKSGEVLEIKQNKDENLENKIKVNSEVNEEIPDKMKIEELKKDNLKQSEIKNIQDTDNDSKNKEEDINKNKKNIINEEENNKEESVQNLEYLNNDQSKTDETTKIYYLNLVCNLIFEIE